jgi:quercetin dioxygenase-like cupin family protein
MQPDSIAPATIVHKPDGRPVRAFGNEILFKLTACETGGAMTLGLTTVPPGGGPPLHRHLHEDELFIILEGRYSIFADDAWTEVEAGAVVYLPRGCIHMFRNIGDTPARHWVLTTPSGFEDYFEQCAAVFAQPGPPDRKRLAEITLESGRELMPGQPPG